MTRLFGWCPEPPRTKPDLYHHLCIREWTNETTGTTHYCECPNHEPREAA